MNKKTIKLKAPYIVGFEEDSHVIYKNGELVYQGDTILYVGPSCDLIVDEEKYFPSCMLIPGFIDLDADVDSDHALQDIAVGTKSFVLDRSMDLIDSYTEEDFRARHRFSMAHLMKNGITTIMPVAGEMFYPWNMSVRECEIMMEEALSIGIRAYIGPSFKSRRFPDEPFDYVKGKQSYEEAILFCKKDFPDLIRPFMNPCQIHITQLEYLKYAAFYAKEHGIPYRLHACEAAREWKYTNDNYGKTSITLFNDEDMLFENFIIPHCITATNKELNILNERKVSVVSTPFADANTGTALFSFDKYVDYGINMTMGTDAHPGDMLRNMKMAWDLDHLCHRRKFFSLYREDGTMIPMMPDEPLYPKTDAKHFFDAATLNGAKALGRTDIGRLCAGAKADIVGIDFHNILIGPMQDPIRTLLNSATGANVREVIVNGHVRISDFKFIDLDETTLLSDAQNAYDRYVLNYHTYDEKKSRLEELFPNTYLLK